MNIRFTLVADCLSKLDEAVVKTQNQKFRLEDNSAGKSASKKSSSRKTRKRKTSKKKLCEDGDSSDDNPSDKFSDGGSDFDEEASNGCSFDFEDESEN